MFCWSKERIMEVYLNSIEMGNGIYGAEAASQFWFNKTAAQLTLESASIIEKTIDTHFIVSFEYKNINKVMRVIKEKNAVIVSQKMELNCEIEITIRKKNAIMLFETFISMFEIAIKVKNYN